MEEGLLGQVNEVVWECGLGPDCTMCSACCSLGGGFVALRPLVRLPLPTAVYALFFECVCKKVCVVMHEVGIHCTHVYVVLYMLCINVHASVCIKAHFHLCIGICTLEPLFF